MKRLSYILSFIPAILIAGNSFSQQVIATAGSSGSGTGIQLSWTIGEPVTSTATSSEFILTQGFQQGQPEIQMEIQSISLSTGWNIISSKVIPGHKNMMDVFQPLIAAGSLIKVQDESGYSLENIFGGWSNNIGDMFLTEGYKVKVNTNNSIEISGTPLLSPYPIPLTVGWNIISYPQTTAFDGLDVVQQLIDGNSLLKVQNEAGYSIEYIFGAWKNDIGDFEGGEGYKVKVSKEDTLWINDTYPTKSVKLQPERETATHFIPAFKGNGTDHMNIHLFNLAESGIKQGDEIGIFDGNVCVGSAKISIQLPISIRTTIGIPVSANDGIEEKNGFTVGNTIETRLYRNGREYPLTLEPLSGSGIVFTKGGSILAQLDLITGTEETPGSNFTEINCYPNPFSEQITLEILLASKQKVNIDVYDTKGALVRTLFGDEAEGKINIYWDGRNQSGAKMISGTYFIKVNESTFKILLEQSDK
jgi:hypothetical protein